MASDISGLQQRIREFCDERDWNQFHNPKDMAVSLCLEAAEVLEHFQWKSPEEMKTYVRTNNSDIAEELSDVLYWVLRMADRFDIDIVQAFDKKMVKNARKYPVAKARGNHKKYTEHQE